MSAPGASGGHLPGWYRVKPAWQRALAPLAGRLVARGVSADVLTALAVILAALGSSCLALSDRELVALLAVPALAGGRLALNVLDGQVARLGGTARPMGEVWNELADRVADLLLLGGLAFVAGVGPLLAGLACVGALLASVPGIAARAAGAPRQYGGVMSKPARMLVLAVAAPAAWVAGAPWPLAVWATLVAARSAVTAAERLRSASRWFRDAAR